MTAGGWTCWFTGHPGHRALLRRYPRVTPDAHGRRARLAGRGSLEWRGPAIHARHGPHPRMPRAANTAPRGRIRPGKTLVEHHLGRWLWGRSQEQLDRPKRRPTFTKRRPSRGKKKRNRVSQARGETCASSHKLTTTTTTKN